MTPDLLLPHDGAVPHFAAPPLACARGSTVIGTVSLGPGARLGPYSVIRGDGETITIGAAFRLGARSTVHIATALLATVIGDRVSVGRNAVVHACTVGSDVVIEDDAVVLDGAVVGDGVLIEAGATVFPRAELEAGFVYGGSPAKRLRPIAPAELAERRARVRDDDEPAAPSGEPALSAGEGAFVADTARLSGRVELAAGSSVFFSCVLDAGPGRITVGAETNIQDNAAILARGEGVTIGARTTLGHNVRTADCRIGAGSLIGIGCVLAPGTVVGDDVLLAGGARTEPGQVLSSGSLWGGRPARILAPLDAKRRDLMRWTVESYCTHGKTYRAQQTGEA